MKTNSWMLHLVWLFLGLIISSSMLYLVNEFNLKMACRYCGIGILLLLINRSRSLTESDAHMLIVGLIISACGFTALFFTWSLAYEICLLGGVFTLVGYSSFVNQQSEIRLFEYAALLFLLCSVLYIIFKLASWQGTAIIESVAFTLVSLLFILQDSKNKEERTPSIPLEENNRNKMLV